jgi:hypothetical protein
MSLIKESISIERDVKFSSELKKRFLSILEGMTNEELIVVGEFAQEKYKGKSRDEIFQKISESKQLAIEGLYAHRILIDEDTWDKIFKNNPLFHYIPYRFTNKEKIWSVSKTLSAYVNTVRDS